MASDFKSVSNKLKELSDNGDIFRLDDDETVSVSGRDLRSEINIPCYQVTRKHLDMVTFGGSKVKDPLADCQNAVKSFIKEFKTNAVDFSSMKVRVSGKSLYSKAVCSSLIFSVDLGESSTVENDIEAWLSVFDKYISGLSTRPVHIAFNNEILEDFSQPHFVVFEDGEFCWYEATLQEKECCDETYKSFLSAMLTKHRLSDYMIYNELAALRLKIKEDCWKELPFTSSRELITSAGLMETYLTTKQEEPGYNETYNTSLVKAYLFESGFIPLERFGDIHYISVGNFDSDVGSSREFEFHNEIVDSNAYLKSCRLSELIDTSTKKHHSVKKTAIKRERKSQDRYVAIYAVHTEPLTLVGFVKCTSKTRHILNKFKYCCQRYSKYHGTSGHSVDIPMIVLECSDKQMLYIDTVIKKQTVMTKKFFFVDRNRYIPMTGGYFSSRDLNDDSFTSMPTGLFDVIGLDLCCVNYDWLIWPKGDLTDYYTPEELSILTSRSFARNGQIYEMLLALANRMDKGCKLSVIWRSDEFSRGMSLETVDGNVCKLSADFAKASPFTLYFHPNKIIISVHVLEEVTIDTDYKTFSDSGENLHSFLRGISDSFRRVVVCSDDKLPKVTQESLKWDLRQSS